MNRKDPLLSGIIDTIPILHEIADVGRDLWNKGWIEGNGGNLSFRFVEKLDSELIPQKDNRKWMELGFTVQGLAGEQILVSVSGKSLYTSIQDLSSSFGIIEINEDGSSYRKVFGFTNSERPTVELPAHLMSQEAIKTTSKRDTCAIIHVHTPHLIALSCLRGLTANSLSSLLWRMHVECSYYFPKGIDYIPWMMSGSHELGSVTAEALRNTPVALWQYHGVLARGRNFTEALAMADIAEKAASLYFLVKSFGNNHRLLSDDEILRTAANFGVSVDEEILMSDISILFPKP